MKHKKQRTEAPDNRQPEESSSPNLALSRRLFLTLGAAGAAGALLATRCSSTPPMKEASQGKAAPPPPGRASVPNRAPLLPVPYTALPLGSIRARGWLLHQLEAQRDGLTGQAEGLLPAIAPDSGWLGGGGESWEKGPYYVKGLVALAYTLDDNGLKAKAQPWIEAMLKSQRADGFFGPPSDTDWWPRMVATYALRDYAEATDDPRVVPMLVKYHQYMAAHIDTQPLHEWAKSRAGDQIDTIFWLYNRTGDASLLALADTLHKQAYDWSDIFTRNRFMEFGDDYQPKHNVNVPQALKMPPVYWQRSHSPLDRTAYTLGVANLARDHGLSLGMNSGTEFLAGRSPTQGVELCSIVERMLSDETALRIQGDASIGDDLERVAFNALPAALTDDIHQHVYFTLPNNVSATRGGLGYNQDYDDARTPAPRSGYPCCCYNFHMGWPKLTQASWAATPGGGLALMTYAPSEVNAQVAGGVPVRFVEETNYPFSETIRLTLDTPQAVRFPLSLRIPAWCKAPVVTVNGQAHPHAAPGTFAVLEREWKTGDVVTVNLPMTVETVPGVNRTVSVRRGPLVYALQIQEKWDVLDKGARPGFDSFQVTPASDWNYGLALDPQHPAASLKVVHRPMPANPFAQAQTPVVIQAQASKVPDWTLAWNGKNAFDPPVRPAHGILENLETVTLVPFGAEMLRVTDFPVLNMALPAASAYHDNFASGHADGWILYGGGWFVRDGALHPASNAGGSSYGMSGVKAIATETLFADFTYDADVSVGPTGDAGLVFRVSKPAIGADAYAGYYAGISAEKGQVLLGKSDNAWTQMQSASVPIAPNKAYHLRVQAQGARLRVFVDDMQKPVFDVQDNAHVAGAIGVRHYGTDPVKIVAAFSGLRVTTA